SAVYNPPLQLLDSQRLEFRDGRKTMLEYCALLLKYGKQNKIDVSAFPNMLTYLQKSKSVFPIAVDTEGLNREMNGLDAQVRASMYTSSAQRTLDALYNRVDVIEKLINVSATPMELADFKANRAGYKVKTFVDFFRAQDSADLLADEEGLFNLDQYLQAVDHFYQVVEKRSGFFVENILGVMQQHNTDIAVMVSGGYHTEGIEAGLKARGISYVSVRPRIMHQDIVNPYYQLLQNRKSPLEKLLAQNQNLISLPINHAEVTRENQFAVLSEQNVEKALANPADLPRVGRFFSLEQLLLNTGLMGWLVETKAFKNILEQKLAIQKNYPADSHQMDFEPLSQNTIAALEKGTPAVMPVKGTNFSVVICADFSKSLDKFAHQVQKINFGNNLDYVVMTRTDVEKYLAELTSLGGRAAFLPSLRLSRVAVSTVMMGVGGAVVQMGSALGSVGQNVSAGFSLLPSFLRELMPRKESAGWRWKLAGSLTGAAGQARLEKLLARALEGAGLASTLVFQPGEVIAAVSKLAAIQAAGVMDAFRKEQGVQGRRLDARLPKRAPPIRGLLAEYLQDAKAKAAAMFPGQAGKQGEVLAALEKINPADFDIEYLQKAPKQQVSEELRQLGAFNIPGIMKVFILGETLRKLNQTQAAAVIFHEALEAAGLAHDVAESLTERVTGLKNEDLIRAAGLQGKPAQVQPQVAEQPLSSEAAGARVAAATTKGVDQIGAKRGTFLGWRGELKLDNLLSLASDNILQPGLALTGLSQLAAEYLLLLVEELFQIGNVRPVKGSQHAETSMRQTEGEVKAQVRQYLDTARARADYRDRVAYVNAFDKIHDVMLNLPLHLLEKIVPQKENTDLENLGLFFLNGEIYFSAEVFRHLSRQDDGKLFIAAILLHETLRMAGLTADQAEDVVREITGFEHDFLVERAGLAKLLAPADAKDIKSADGEHAEFFAGAAVSGRQEGLENSIADYIEQTAGKLSSVLIFQDWPEREITSKSLETIARAGAVPMVTWEPWDSRFPRHQT
ncbi:MAG: hypothetical protein HGA76_10315, partial [Candidatus Firestonebacteria bacterium]|nr:hypothetical protein [Candidatus Firestonebacteria bacterium]